MSSPGLDADRLLQTSPAVAWDGAVAFALFTPLLFILQLGSYGALLFVIVTLAWAACRYRSLPAIVGRHWFVLLLPAFAFISTLWSDLPGETLKHSTEFAITVLAALLLASARNPRSMLLGLFLAFLFYTAVSLAVGHRVDIGGEGVRALSGLNESKNEEASVAATGFIISAFLFVVSARSRKFLQCAAAGAAAALQLYVTIAARSTGALAGLAAALGFLALLLVLRRSGSLARAAILGTVGSCAISILVLFETAGGAWLQRLAALFGKDPTLTGRTYLWFRANDLVADKPLLGKGFGAFWQQGNPDAEGLWQYAQITSRQGFNFHSTLYNSLVSLGWIGTLVLVVTFAAGLASVGVAYVRRPAFIACFWLSMAAYLFIRMPTETVGLNEFYFSTVLLFAALGSTRHGAAPRVVFHANKSLISLSPERAAR